MSGNPPFLLSWILSHTTSPPSLWISGPHKTLGMSELSLFAMQLYFRALQPLKPFAERTSDNSSFYANESVKRSLCSLPLGKPSSPSPLTSQSAPPEGSLHWNPSVKTLHCRGSCWHWSRHWDYLFLQIWIKCPGIPMPQWGEGRRRKSAWPVVVCGSHQTPYREKDNLARCVKSLWTWPPKLLLWPLHKW